MIVRLEITSQKNDLNSIANWVMNGYDIVYEADGSVYAVMEDARPAEVQPPTIFLKRQ